MLAPSRRFRLSLSDWISASLGGFRGERMTCASSVGVGASVSAGAGDGVGMSVGEEDGAGAAVGDGAGTSGDGEGVAVGLDEETSPFRKVRKRVMT